IAEDLSRAARQCQPLAADRGIGGLGGGQRPREDCEHHGQDEDRQGQRAARQGHTPLSAASPYGIGVASDSRLAAIRTTRGSDMLNTNTAASTSVPPAICTAPSVSPNTRKARI